MKYKRDEINELLVDYMEGEVSEGLKNDLDIVLKNSPVREKNLKALDETRRVVKGAEGQVPEMSDAFFDQLHSKIMSEVSEVVPHTRGRLWLERQSYNWRSVSAAAMVVLVAGTLLFSSLRPSVKIESAGIEKQGDMLLSISVEVPEAFADSLLNDRGDDFLMDAMAEKVAHLEEKDVSKVMKELRE